MTTSSEFHDRLLSLGLARVSEAAALASAKLVGRGDEKAADQAAVDAMRTQLNMLDIAAAWSSAKASATKRRCCISAKRWAAAPAPKWISRWTRWKAPR